MSRVDTQCPNEEKATRTMLKVGPIPSLDAPKISRIARTEREKETIWDEKGRGKLTQMFISYEDDCIKSLAFQYVEDDGKFTLSPIFGCQNLYASHFETVMFGDASEDKHITRVSGLYQLRSIGPRLTSLTIETNESTYGPFGKTGGNSFVDKAFHISLGNGDQFGGFHGCSNLDHVISIGVYLKPLQNLGNKLYKKNDYLPIVTD